MPQSFSLWSKVQPAMPTYGTDAAVTADNNPFQPIAAANEEVVSRLPFKNASIVNYTHLL